MADKNYLYKVLGLSALPRLLTFGLTLLSFPIMVRGLGAQQYGVMVYLTSLTGLLELMAGFGVSSAVGKAIADCRAHSAAEVGVELGRWFRLQLLVCACSLLPAIAAGYLMIHSDQGRQIEPGLLALALTALYVSIFVAFVRASLSSMLAFKRLAMLDATESVVRSASWVVVGLFVPTVWALAWAALATAATALAAGALLLRGLLSDGAADAAPPAAPAPSRHAATGRLTMLHESARFLALTVGTRAYQTLPVLLVGKLLGFEITGILGAFTKIVEILSLPFTVIGNALMVRAPELRARGSAALGRYWDMLFRLAAIALAVAAGFWLAGAEIARMMLPKSDAARGLFLILSVLILARSVSDLFAPASDYVGGLRSRIIFLGSFAAAQLPVIWLAIEYGEATGAVLAIVASYSLMVAGYMLIAKRAFFGAARYAPPADFYLAILVILVGAALVFLSPLAMAGRVAAYATIIALLFGMIPALRASFWPTRLIKFDFIQ